jgi:hypothetical protein
MTYTQVAHPSDSEQPSNFVPEYRNYLICVDESGTGGAKYYGFGSLWMPWDRRGDFSKLITTLRSSHRYDNEIKWNKISTRNEAFYKALVSAFFRQRYLMFHCVLIRKGYVDKDLHGHDDPYDQARRKHFAMLIKSKIEFFAEPDIKKAYHAWIDPLPSRYKKAAEAAHKIINSSLNQRLKQTALYSLQERDSKTTPGIQVADLLLGAVASSWNNESPGGAKLTIMKEVARHLGWEDLRADTWRSEWKFNIWYFYDPTTHEGRESQTREVNHLVPTPPYRRRR